jgi:ATP-dependent DNA helicase RecQ
VGERLLRRREILERAADHVAPSHDREAGAGYILVAGEDHSRLPDARAVLRGEVSLMLREQAAGVARKKRSSKPTKTSVKGMAEASLNAGALERLGRLKAWRAEVAREHNLPAFVIFHDATLRAIADKAPQGLADLEGISGMGSKKLHAYGAEVIRVCTALA